MGYDNSLNRLSDVFNLVFSYVKIEVAPVDNSSEQDIADYNSLISESSDLPLIVYECVKDCYPHTSHSKEDVKYCEYFIENYQNVCSFKKKAVSL